MSSNLVAFFFKNDFNYRFKSMIEQAIHESPTFQQFINGTKVRLTDFRWKFF